MLDERPNSTARSERLREVLLCYLQVAVCPLWPGTDGLTVEDILLSYPQNAAAGRVPNVQELLRRQPDLREALLAFFADTAAARQTAGPCSAVSRQAPAEAESNAIVRYLPKRASRPTAIPRTPLPGRGGVSEGVRKRSFPRPRHIMTCGEK